MSNSSKTKPTDKLRDDLTDEQKAKAERIGRITFKSTRSPDMRVEPFIPSRDQH